MGTIEVGEATLGRAPAKAYLDGFDSPAFYRPGRAVTGRPYVMIHQGDRTRASVGSFSSVGPDVVLMVGGNHRIDWVTTFAVRELYDLDGAYEGNPGSRGDIDIGADVTIGRGAVVLSGVTVGHGAVISPFAVVTRDVRPFAVVAGCPAREVGRRFDDDQVDRLLRLAWWEWPGARIRSEFGVPESIAQALLEDEKRAKTWRLTVELNKARLKVAWALEGVASRIAPPRSPPSPPDFPLRIWSYPETVLAMGWGVGGGCPPVVHHDDTGRWRATVGNYCSLAYDAELVLDGGPLPTPLSAVALGLDPDAGRRSAVGDITIGSDVWLTRGAKVLAGVTIGHGAVIAAYAVVTEDVRPFAIVAGNPAREVSRRFDDATVEALLRIAWWEWPEDVVRERAADLVSADVAAFVERYGAHV